MYVHCIRIFMFFFCRGSKIKCQCKGVGSSQAKFNDEIRFEVLATEGIYFDLQNGSISDTSSRPFQLDCVYSITRLPGLALKFEIIEINK